MVQKSLRMVGPGGHTETFQNGNLIERRVHSVFSIKEPVGQLILKHFSIKEPVGQLILKRFSIKE